MEKVSTDYDAVFVPNQQLTRNISRLFYTSMNQPLRRVLQTTITDKK